MFAKVGSMIGVITLELKNSLVVKLKKVILSRHYTLDPRFYPRFFDNMAFIYPKRKAKPFSYLFIFSFIYPKCKAKPFSYLFICPLFWECSHFKALLYIPLYSMVGLSTWNNALNIMFLFFFKVGHFLIMVRMTWLKR
jgi:hypothetical protein